MPSQNPPSWPIPLYGTASTQAAGENVGFTGVTTSDSAALVDTEDMTFAFVPSFASANGNLTQGNLSPYGTYAVYSGPASNYAASQSIVGGVGVMNAVLVEFRVFVALLAWQMMDQGPDAGQLRADELNNSGLGTGAV